MALTESIDAIYRTVFAESRVHAEETVVVIAAVIGFLVHLGLVAWSQGTGDFAHLEWFSSSYLAALYTPFSFLLFYEVLLLVRAIPASLSQAMGKQYEVVTLIVLRRVFKDIAGLDSSDSLDLLAPEVLSVGADMVGALLLYGLVLLFRRSVARSGRQSVEVPGFVAFKQAVSVGLGLLVLWLAVTSLVVWGLDMVAVAAGQDVAMSDVNAVFYEDFFGVLVLVDVLILVVSFAFIHDIDMVFRNAGFVASTVLVRLSFQAERIQSLAILLFAVAFGLAVHWIVRWGAERLAQDLAMADRAAADGSEAESS